MQKAAGRALARQHGLMRCLSCAAFPRVRETRGVGIKTSIYICRCLLRRWLGRWSGLHIAVRERDVAHASAASAALKQVGGHYVVHLLRLRLALHGAPAEFAA